MEDVIRASLIKLQQHQTVTLGNFNLSNTQLIRNTDHKVFHLKELEVKQKSDHLEINSNEDGKKYMRLKYDREWDWPILESILNELLNNS